MYSVVVGRRGPTDALSRRTVFQKSRPTADRQSCVPAATAVHTAVRQHVCHEPVLRPGGAVCHVIQPVPVRSVPLPLDCQEVLES